MQGSRRSDGRLKFSSRETVLWDNKSTEAAYIFPQDHVEQFLGYIRSEAVRPTLFLVVVGHYEPQAVIQAQKLKAMNESDTDVALITASDLKYVAENWRSYSGRKDPEFLLQVFNITGALTREVLQNRMSWILK